MSVPLTHSNSDNSMVASKQNKRLCFIRKTFILPDAPYYNSKKKDIIRERISRNKIKNHSLRDIEFVEGISSKNFKSAQKRSLKYARKLIFGSLNLIPIIPILKLMSLRKLILYLPQTILPQFKRLSNIFRIPNFKCATHFAVSVNENIFTNKLESEIFKASKPMRRLRGVSSFLIPTCEESKGRSTFFSKLYSKLKNLSYFNIDSPLLDPALYDHCLNGRLRRLSLSCYSASHLSCLSESITLLTDCNRLESLDLYISLKHVTPDFAKFFSRFSLFFYRKTAIRFLKKLLLKFTNGISEVENFEDFFTSIAGLEYVEDLSLSFKSYKDIHLGLQAMTENSLTHLKHLYLGNIPSISKEEKPEYRKTMFTLRKFLDTLQGLQSIRLTIPVISHQSSGVGKKIKDFFTSKISLNSNTLGFFSSFFPKTLICFEANELKIKNKDDLASLLRGFREAKNLKTIKLTLDTKPIIKLNQLHPFLETLGHLNHLDTLVLTWKTADPKLIFKTISKLSNLRCLILSWSHLTHNEKEMQEDFHESSKMITNLRHLSQLKLTSICSKKQANYRSVTIFEDLVNKFPGLKKLEVVLQEQDEQNLSTKFSIRKEKW